MDLRQILDNDGEKMIRGQSDNFGKHFDWIFTGGGVIKQKDVPYTIYVKIDYLPHFINSLHNELHSPFILITSCSDYSPSINFINEYKFIIHHPLLLYWYATNNLSLNKKIESIPGGISTSLSSIPNYINDLSEIRKSIVPTEKISKILCIWRDRNFNVCGDQFITRDKVKNFVLQYPEIFDWVEPNLESREFFELVAKYKYVLCPVGNGVDPCPKSFEAIILKTLPIMIRTINTVDVYSILPGLLVEDFSELLINGVLENAYDSWSEILNGDEILEKMTCQYWANKIMTTQI